MKTRRDGKIMRTFLLYAFVFAWGSELLIIAAYRLGLMTGRIGSFLHYGLIIIGPGLSPAYAAFIIWKKYESVTIKSFFKRIFYTGNIHLTVILTLVFACIQFAACVMLEKYRGNSWYLFILYIPLMVLGGGLEEIGWRGILQPLMEERFPFLIAAVAEGILWSIWHLPLWFVPDSSQSSFSFTAFMLYCIVLGCTLAAVYRLTHSIWACILIHAWGNTTVGGMYTFTTLTEFPNIKTVSVYIIQIVLIILICKLYDRLFTTLKKDNEHM
jgi:uncharacterized protein